MKASKYFIIAMVFLALVGCKKGKTDEGNGMVEEEVREVVPNESDVKFAEALKYLENEQDSQAAKSIKEGVTEVGREAKYTLGNGNENLETSIAKLNELSNKLQNGGNVQINNLRRLMAKIEIGVHHSYLGNEDILFLNDNSPSSNAEASHTKLKATISDLKKEDGKVTGNTKTEYDALMTEGKKLEDDFQNWDKRTVEYDKKVIEHKIKQHPE